MSWFASSKSSNVANAITNVTNSISQSTKADSAQVNYASKSTEFNNCNVNLKGDLNVTSLATTSVQNSQVAKAMQDANVKNTVNQKMLQAATSTVGSFGIGYSEANNTSNSFVNASSQVANTMQTSSNQYSYDNQKFTCNNSTINANNINIDMSSGSNFLSSQTIENSQVAKLSNDITQTVDQKATAEVTGFGGFLMLIMLLIIAGVFMFGKLINSKPVKILMTVLIFLFTITYLLTSYIGKYPPIFGEEQDCLSGSGTGCSSGCVDTSSTSVKMDTPPIKYLHPVWKQTGGSTGIGNLVEIAISAVATSGSDSLGSNGGYRADIADLIANKVLEMNKICDSIYQDSEIRMPNLMTIPTNSDSTLYKIPDAYSLDSSNSKCTPKAVSVSNSGSTDASYNNCPLSVNPSILQTTSNKAQAIAQLNSGDWDKYCDQSHPKYKKRMLFARFALHKIIGSVSDMFICIDKENEIVSYSDPATSSNITVLAKDASSSQIAIFVPITYPDFGAGFGGGTLQANMGKCDTRTYKVQKLLTSPVGWIGLAFVLIVEIIMIISAVRSNDS